MYLALFIAPGMRMYMNYLLYCSVSIVYDNLALEGVVLFGNAYSIGLEICLITCDLFFVPLEICQFLSFSLVN